MSIADNLRRVQERIARAAESAGRRASDLTLVGVTKYVGPEEAAALVAAGCRHLGESRPQELWRKYDALSPSVAAPQIDGMVASATMSGTPRSPIYWHLIGHLQRNKVARTLPLVSLIHSVDSLRLFAAINEAAAILAATSRIPPLPLGEGRGEGALDGADTTSLVDVLLEVNTSNEPAKHGLAPNDVEPILAAAENYRHVSIRGLMTMAALEGGDTAAARNFATLRELRDRLQPNTPPCVQLNELSMGMSGDFEIAIKEGATIVRVGSALWE